MIPSLNKDQKGIMGEAKLHVIRARIEGDIHDKVACGYAIDVRG